MTLASKALKQQAREAIRTAAPSAVLITLVYLLCTDILDNLVFFFTPDFSLSDLIYGHGAGVWISLFLTILMSLFLLVMKLGYWSWSLSVAREQPAGFGTLLDGFGMLGQAILMEVLIFLRIFGWSFFLAFGYVILAMLLSFSPLLIAAVTGAFYVALLMMVLRYELAPVLLCDYPQAGAGAAVHRSAEMMRGHVWDYIKLHLSLWPWYLLIFLIQLAANLFFLSPSLDAISASFAAGGFEQVLTQVDMLLSSAAPSLVTAALTVPVNLFFLPLRHVSVANFYRTLSCENTGAAPFDMEL